MRIVDRKTFLALPAGTVYAKYETGVLDSPDIKDETVGFGVDWYFQPLTPDFEGVTDSLGHHNALLAMQAGAPSPPVDYDVTSRDGYFDQDQLFAVWDRPDLEALIARLQRALAEGYPETPRC